MELIRRAVRYSRARRDLTVNDMCEYADGVDRETPEFLRLNRAVADAEAGVPGWLREVIDRWILWRTGYWRVVS